MLATTLSKRCHCVQHQSAIRCGARSQKEVSLTPSAQLKCIIPRARGKHPNLQHSGPCLPVWLDELRLPYAFVLSFWRASYVSCYTNQNTMQARCKGEKPSAPTPERDKSDARRWSGEYYRASVVCNRATAAIGRYRRTSKAVGSCNESQQGFISLTLCMSDSIGKRGYIYFLAQDRPVFPSEEVLRGPAG